MRAQLFTTFLTLSTLVLFTGCSDDGDQARQGQSNRAPTVEAIQVITGNLPLEETLTGSVRARNQTDIYPQISAPVTAVSANNGDTVREGDILARLRDVEARDRLRQAEAGYEIARAQVRQAEADLNRRKTSLERVRQLRSRDLETQAELDNMEAEVEAAEATLDLNNARKNQARSIIDERKNELENTIIRAPVDGVLGLRNAEVGQQVSSSTRLFQIGDPESMKIEMVLTESMTGYIFPGQPAIIASSVTGLSMESTITRISPFLNPVTHTTTAEIEVSNPDRFLRPGMFVTVTVKYGESEQAILVPNNAIFHHPDHGTHGVFIADNVGQELTFEGEDPPRELTGTSPVRFVPVDVVARGRQVSGIAGIPNDTWVVTLGHNLLLRGAERANVRPVDWDHILNLQQMQSRDLFDIIQEKMAKRNNNYTPDA
ncbi:MAG: efflux RND transporter periplasmic adaptor subunit [Balneolaceae bacterium]|nr:MAG: efflux RND transporter periplasmic adaptor subunit [Balneolaceae bacterium]TVS09017.1 MAG: efflux RND transporter periplasmic adaptor subunit [Planctomycetaceae bacterium]